ncbi:YsnF/AvaK domain-containing protein [Oscillatoria amoena NRMC-F 0135]|nr:YsnF/AvaK domain-containing protein [Oscillatoria laete-virens]MDI9635751.1 YsnF/AvaK domain-containing protein [Geitlerinema splendidum]MDL5050477.1 YsnF/AvaK domain-containing protein [Oscillatoria amoena NRMC-F 0135]MDL5053781.1 YsnF/AvaK domain-containing protein [Oscillatoria laete-virens NRMC-F 0139]
MVDPKIRRDDDPAVDRTDTNPDPISGQPGAHPVGTGIGAAGVGTVGTVVGGVIGGPVGAVVGAAVGAVAGGLVGKGVAEAVNPSIEDEYWRQNYATRSYVTPDETYDNYAPAYRTGYEGYARHAENPKTYAEVEPELENTYNQTYGNTALPWDKAKHAARDAYIKLYEERLVAGKHRDKVGEVSVGKHVESETARVSVPVTQEKAIVERVPVDNSTPVNPDRVNFGETEAKRVEIYEERPEIHKEAFVRENVDVRKEVDRETIEAEEQVRRERLDIDTEGRPNIKR